MAVLETLVQQGEELVNGGGNHGLLKVATRCLSKIWPYAGTSENLLLPS